MAEPHGGGAPTAECRPRSELQAAQYQRLAILLSTIYGQNSFYSRKFDAAGLSPDRLELPQDLVRLPFTTKAELVADQQAAPPWGTAHTPPLERFTRYHQTSSTTGRPLRWLDTDDSWQWALDCWKAVYRAARVNTKDCIFFPFGFGPFLGFWTAFDAGTQLGALCIPAGGMSSRTRLDLIDTLQPTVICCTPTYALRLADVAYDSGRHDLAQGPVRVIIVAGEPGGNVPATRQQIEKQWGARVIDHHGLTEVGPVSFECWESPGALHLNEREFLCEVIDPATGEPVAEGRAGELVVTTLGRTASPVVRYRTRDIVRLRYEPCLCGRTLARADGGILSRADDMVCVRGVNVYPTAIEAVVRQFHDVLEFRSTVTSRNALLSLTIEIELRPGSEPDTAVAGVAQGLREATGLTVPVRVVSPGSLPRFELKARRFIVDPEARAKHDSHDPEAGAPTDP